MLHKHLTVTCAHTSISLHPHMQSQLPHMLSSSSFILLFWNSSLLVISYQLYYLAAVFVFPYLLEHIQSTSVLQPQTGALCNTELFERITDSFSGSFFFFHLCLGELAGHRNNEKPLLSCHHLKSFLEFISKQNKTTNFSKISNSQHL